jgi:poly(A) polymerase
MNGWMSDPVIVPRSGHTISRRDIDPDALRVLYRLRDFNHTAYLVGGGVRDLLLGRRPKDFDVGTDAHPYQIKKLFRNCWIIGRRFRLAHVRFGPKTIEVATFRRNLPVDPASDAAPAPDAHESHGSTDGHHRHDNTFGTAEEDAFRRDFTINALFYDIATFSVIDYVGGLDDLKARLIRSIGDPVQRFREDPVRMLRAVAFAARLDFSLDPPIVAAIESERHLMAKAAPARLIEEYYKVLRSGAAERTFRSLAEHRLLDVVTPELQRRTSGDALWEALEALDDYRLRFESAPHTLTNPVLLGSLIVPIGLMPKRDRHAQEPGDVDEARVEETGASAEDEGSEGCDDGAWQRRGRRDRRWKPPVLRIGALPIARRDTERLRQVLALQSRLRDLESSARAKRALMHRGPFEEALTWLEIHGDVPEIVEHWRGFIEALEGGAAPTTAEEEAVPPPGDGRRRRRRGGRRRRGRGFRV